MTPPPVAVAEFAGPLDLLLEEVRERNIAIEDIAMAPLVSRFLEYLRSARDRNLNLDIEWLLVASTLIQWKSRSLLPQHPVQPAEPDPVRDELVRQLVAHRKELAEELGKRKTISDASLSRPGERPGADDHLTDEAPDPPFRSVWDLTQQARDLARWAADYRATLSHFQLTFDGEPELVTVAEMSQVLRHYLSQADTLPVDALPLLDGQPTAGRRSALFLGLLEMVREQELTAHQAEGFGSVWLAGRDFSTRGKA